jgi:hypothetical protein
MKQIAGEAENIKAAQKQAKEEATNTLSESEVIKERGTQDVSNKENVSLQKEKDLLSSKVFSIAMMEGNDTRTKFYTGLPTYPVFLHVFLFFSPFITPSKCVV